MVPNPMNTTGETNNKKAVRFPGPPDSNAYVAQNTADAQNPYKTRDIVTTSKAMRRIRVGRIRSKSYASFRSIDTPASGSEPLF